MKVAEIRRKKLIFIWEANEANEIKFGTIAPLMYQVSAFKAFAGKITKPTKFPE